MTLEAGWVALLAVVSLALGASGRVTLDAVGVLLVGALALSGVLPARDALSGFGDPTVVTLASLYVVGEGLTRTGALEFLARAALRTSRGGETRLLFALCGCAAAISSVVSDTAVVLVFLPIAVKLARERGVPAGRYLLPIAFSALFGGMVTLIGSSINLLTSSAAAGLSAPPLGLFDLTPFGLPIALGGVLLTVLLSRCLHRDHPSLTDLLPEGPTREFVAELVVSETSVLVGRRLGDLLRETRVQAPFVLQGGRVVAQGTLEHVLSAQDVVMLQGSPESLVAFQERMRIQVIGAEGMTGHEVHYFEAAVAPRSHLVGRRIGDLELQRDLGVVPVAILRDGHHIRERLLTLKLRSGDLLLLCGDDTARERVRNSTDFFLVAGSAATVVHRRLARRALAVLGGLLLVFLVGAAWPKRAIPLPLASLLAATAMVSFGCVRARRAYRSIDWSVLVFVVGALALGRAMESSGLAANVASAVVSPLQTFGPLAVLSGLFLTATILNQLTSPYAIAVVMIPIALEAAAQLGVSDVRPFVLATALAGSNAFATPMGHQVNLMVMGPGGYRYSDFLRLGIPLCLYTWLGVTLLFAWRGIV